MAKKKSSKRTVVIVPKSVEELTEFIGKIGEHQRGLDKIQTKLNNQVEEIKTRAVADSLTYQETIDQLFEGIYIFAESHRDELTEKGKKKTVTLPTGDLLWRLNPPSVSFRRGWDNDKVVELCKALDLPGFIRTKEEVDKEAMLKRPEVAETIEGVKIEQKEQFVVKPSEIGIEISKDTKKLQKTIK